MTDKAISPLRRLLIEDMAIRRLGPANKIIVKEKSKIHLPVLGLVL